MAFSSRFDHTSSRSSGSAGSRMEPLAEKSILTRRCRATGCMRSIADWQVIADIHGRKLSTQISGGPLLRARQPQHGVQ